MFPYYIYLTLCYLTQPFRWLLGYKNELFAIRLLWFNNYKANYVTSQLQHESGDFKSAVYQDNNNCTGMRPSLRQEYQSGEGRGYAKYRNVYQCVYDYYDRVKNKQRSPLYGTDLNEAINDIPNSAFKKGSADHANYVSSTAYAFKASGYYSAPWLAYSTAVRGWAFRNDNTLWKYVCNWLLLLSMPAVIPVVLHLSSGKRKR